MSGVRVAEVQVEVATDEVVLVLRPAADPSGEWLIMADGFRAHVPTELAGALLGRPRRHRDRQAAEDAARILATDLSRLVVQLRRLQRDAQLLLEAYAVDVPAAAARP